jgi:hypothetical protein
MWLSNEDKQRTRHSDFNEIAQDRQAHFCKQFFVLLGRFQLFTWRNPLSIVFLCGLACWNGLLESVIFHNVGQITSVENDPTAVLNYIGLAFLASSDIFQIMAFAQVIQMPQIYPVFFREVSNNMYSATAFYLAAQVSILTTFIYYPIIITVVSYWNFGLVDTSIHNFFEYLCCMVGMMLAGASIGFAFGTIFGDTLIAMKILENLATLF